MGYCTCPLLVARVSCEAQGPITALQPLAPWTPNTEYVPHEAVSCPYSADMYVQPVCPSYTVVGPSSVLTYASQPLITNVTVRHMKAFMQRAPF